MLYDNEITIIFNLVNTRTSKIISKFLKDYSLCPHILRIPKEKINKDVDTFLETYEPLLNFLKMECQTYEDWKYGKIMYYNVQEDCYEDVVVKKIIEMPQEAKKYAERVIIKILDRCLSKFNLINIYGSGSFTESFEEIIKVLSKKNMSRESVMLYIISKAQETEDEEILNIIQEITKIN